jgi:hypothetical protein
MLSIEEKEKILSRACIRVEDVMKLTGYSKSYCYEIMKDCRKEFNGQAGIRTDAILTKSLFAYLGTTLEEELASIIRAKELAKIRD